MADDPSGFRIFILGAGFSVPAGLPSALDLYSLVTNFIAKSSNSTIFGRSGFAEFEEARDSFLEYQNSYAKTKVDESSIDFEEFLKFVDFQHFLSLEEDKTWSREGNKTQLIIRDAIGKVIQTHTPQVQDIPDFYFKFADCLKPTDKIVTLNYDILLERCLEACGKEFRLFPRRFSEVAGPYSRVDSEKEKEEIMLLKIHGSIDWFDNREFLDRDKQFKAFGLSAPKDNMIFSDLSRFNTHQIVEGPRAEDDPFAHIHKIEDVDSYYSLERRTNFPFLLAPSYAKFLHSRPFFDFWNEIGPAGSHRSGISVIGYSLPEHDEHMRMWLFRLLSDFQKSNWQYEPLAPKDKIKFVDLRNGEEQVKEYKRHYSFADPSKSSFHLSGFDEEAVEFLFTLQRQ